jgi:hypothetical protein
MILTNLPISKLKYFTKLSIFDHAYVQASFGQKREQTTPTMKDYILSSEEFLLQYYDLLKTELASSIPLANGPQPQHLPIEDSPPVDKDTYPSSTHSSSS